MSCRNCIQQFARGVVGRTKSWAGIGIAPPQVITERLDICRECEHCTRNPDLKFAATKGMSTKSRCDVCKCPLKHKTRIASEKCPMEKWLAIVAKPKS